MGLVCLIAAPGIAAQDCSDLFNPHQVLDFHLTMDPADWDALRTSCPAGICGSRPHFYWSATFRCENGPEIQVGFRRKNGKAEPSESDPQKPALKIDINEFVSGQTFFGKVKLNLENGGDSSGGGGDGGSENGIREGFSWLLHNDAGAVASRVAWVNIWVNGDLKGLYANVEQVDKAFLVDHGIDEGGWLFKGPSNDQRTREGETNPYQFNWYPFDHVNPDDPQPADWHDQTDWRVDMGQALTIAASTNFMSNRDAVVFKNNNYWYYDWAIFPEGQQPRLYLPWDLDTTLKKVDEPILGTPTNNGHMAQGLLRDDPVFQAQYYQTYNNLMNGPFSLAATTARVDALEPILTSHINADPNTTVGNAATQFQNVRDFLQARTAFVLAQLGTCPDTTCEPAENSCICPADCGAPPAIETVCDDGLDDDCDGPIDCADSDCNLDPACNIPAPTNTLVVNEVISNSPGSPDVEYVEILNLGPGTQDLTGWYIIDDDNGHDPCYLDGTLDVGEYRIVAGFNSEFLSRYPEAASKLNTAEFDSIVSGQGFSLGDGGDHVRLFRTLPSGAEFVDGYTLGPQSEEVPFGYIPEQSDAPEYIVAPTPGLNNELSSVFSPICINEFLTTSALGGIDDWVELYNRGAVTVDISGWHLSDAAEQPTKYTFPAGTTIEPGKFLTVDEVELGFALSSTGSEVIVLTHADGVTGQDYFDFDTQFPDVTRGRFPDGASTWLFFDSPTRQASNGCRVGNLRFVSQVEFDWDPFSGATLYDIVRGDLELLRSTWGDFSQAVTGCEDDDTTATSWTDVLSLAPGEALFYLVRVVDSTCGVGSYDAGLAVRDASVLSAPAGCP